MVPDHIAWLHPPAFSACIVSSYLSWRIQFRFDFLFDIAHGYPFPRAFVHTSVAGLVILGAMTSEVTCKSEAIVTNFRNNWKAKKD